MCVCVRVCVCACVHYCVLETTSKNCCQVYKEYILLLWRSCTRLNKLKVQYQSKLALHILCLYIQTQNICFGTMYVWTASTKTYKNVSIKMQYVDLWALRPVGLGLLGDRMWFADVHGCLTHGEVGELRRMMPPEQMAASVQTPKTGGVGTYFTWIWGRNDVHWKVQEKKRKHKYSSDLKDAFVPSEAFEFNEILLILMICIHLYTATRVPSVSNEL